MKKKAVNIRALYRTGVLHGAGTTASLFVAYLLFDKRAKKIKEESLARAENERAMRAGSPTSEPDIDKVNEDVNKLNRGREILKYGIPEYGRELRYYSNHVLVYDQHKRTPTWVAEHITSDILKGPANRKEARFRPDPGVSSMFTALNTDYWKSGWSRGHMAPAGNNKQSQEAMQDSFNLTNVVPQNLENNAGFWNRLEMYCRDLTKKYSNVYIISGPLMLPTEEENGKRFVKYQVIGENDVAVPTHLFKVIIVEDKHNNPKAISAFVVPNEPIGYDHKLTEYEVNLGLLEKALGVKLVPKLENDKVKSLCKVDGCKLMDRNEFELYFIGRKVQSANTLNRLETVWNELEEKKLKPTRDLKKLYQQRKDELEIKEKAKST